MNIGYFLKGRILIVVDVNAQQSFDKMP